MPAILITGANRGLGLEFARQYAADGWRVFATCRDPVSASNLKNLADASNGAMEIVALDVADLASIKAAARRFDGAPIDVLLNGAGVMGPRQQQQFGRIDYTAWIDVLDINTLGPMRVSEAFIEHVARSDRKLIVTITSGMGSLADNTSGGWIAYRTSKAAVNMVMRSLAIDLAPRGISCVVVNPGWVRTDMGGPTATLSPQESITAMKRLIERLGPNQSGKFFNYNGREYPW
jgi:NAD(P)-dependent dehydrogenase (short-subunit alcohol dehydrogenase family)